MSPNDIAALLKLARENGIPVGGPEDIQDVSQRPKIRLPGDNRELGQFAREVGEILSKQNLFRRDLIPVTVNTEKKRTDPVSSEWLRTWAEHHLVCFKERELGSGTNARVIQIVKTMNVDTARGTLASEQFFGQLREIDRVNTIRMPVIMPDGRIELAPIGYCADSRVFTVENEIVYDEGMTLDRAKEIICELYSQFPFVGHERCLAVQLAALLTVFAVGILPKTATRPGFIYIANDSDAGKTMLAKSAITPVTGEISERAFPRSEETRKALDQLAVDGVPVVLFDNVKGKLGGEEIEAFMTSTRRSGRIIGEGGGFNVPNVTTCFFTGNDFEVTRDMCQRCLFVELFIAEIDSSKRIFKRIITEQLLADVVFRNEICSALWTMVQHWDAKGRPRARTIMPKCPQWSAVIGGIVEAVGFGDCCAKPEIANNGGDVLEMQKLVRELAPGTADQSRSTFPEVMSKIRELGLFENLELRSKKGEIQEVTDSEGNLTPAGRSHFGRLFRKFDQRLFPGEDGERLRWVVHGPKDSRKFLVVREPVS